MNLNALIFTRLFPLTRIVRPEALRCGCAGQAGTKRVCPCQIRVLQESSPGGSVGTHGPLPEAKSKSLMTSALLDNLEQAADAKLCVPPTGQGKSLATGMRLNCKDSAEAPTPGEPPMVASCSVSRFGCGRSGQTPGCGNALTPANVRPTEPLPERPVEPAREAGRSHTNPAGEPQSRFR